MCLVIIFVTDGVSKTETGQAQERYLLIVHQMARAEGVTEDLKRHSQLDWVQPAILVHDTLDISS